MSEGIFYCCVYIYVCCMREWGGLERLWEEGGVGYGRVGGGVYIF